MWNKPSGSVVELAVKYGCRLSEQRSMAETTVMKHCNHSRPRHGRGHPGQTLVIALSVMFLLFFIGALFVALVAHNLGRVASTGERTSATSLAQSGLDWVNTQLTYSEP